MYLSHCEIRQSNDPIMPLSAISGYQSWTTRDFTVTETGPLKWKYSLHDLLRSPAGERAFATFLKSEYSGENLTFWLAAKKFKSGPGKKFYIEKILMTWSSKVSFRNISDLRKVRIVNKKLSTYASKMKFVQKKKLKNQQKYNSEF